MKLLKNKTVVGIIAIIAGILVCFLLSPIYNKALEQKTRIVMVTVNITKGSKISKDDVKEIEVGSYNIPKDVVTDKKSVVGKYAKADLYKEDYILPLKVSDTPLSNNEYLENLDGTSGAVSITLPSLASGLSGKLLNGDIVSIIATDTDSNSTDIPPELRYVKVLASTTAEGTDMNANSVSQKEDNGNSSLPATVTLLVNDQQAKRLASLENNGKIHIELIYRGDDKICNQFLGEQKKVLDGLKADESGQAGSTDNTNMDKQNKAGE